MHRVRGGHGWKWLSHAVLVALVISSWGCGSSEKQAAPGANLDKLIRDGKLAEAERVCRALVKKNDSDAVARGTLARVLCLRGDAVLAEIGFFDLDPEKAKKAKEDPHFEEALGFFQAAAAEARLVFKKLPEKKWPQFAEVRATLGLALHRLGRSEEAVRELKRAVAENRYEAGAHNTLGLIYHESGRKDLALVHFQAALAANPGLAEAAYNLAVYYEDDLTDLAEAEQQAREMKTPPPKDLAGRKAGARKAAIRYYRHFLKESGGRRVEEVRARVRKLEKLEGRASAGPAAPEAA